MVELRVATHCANHGLFDAIPRKILDHQRDRRYLLICNIEGCKGELIKLN